MSKHFPYSTFCSQCVWRDLPYFLWCHLEALSLGKAGFSWHHLYLSLYSSVQAHPCFYHLYGAFLHWRSTTNTLLAQRSLLMSACLSKYQNKWFFCLESVWDHVSLKAFQLFWTPLPFRAGSTGIPLNNFLNKLKSGLLNSSICSLLLSFHTPCRNSDLTSCWFTHPQPFLPCHWAAEIVMSSWSPLSLFQEVIPDALQKPPVLLVFHTSLLVDVRKVKLLCEKQGLFFRPPPNHRLFTLHHPSHWRDPFTWADPSLWQQAPYILIFQSISPGEPRPAHGSHPGCTGCHFLVIPTTLQLSGGKKQVF